MNWYVAAKTLLALPWPRKNLSFPPRTHQSRQIKTTGPRQVSQSDVPAMSGAGSSSAKKKRNAPHAEPNAEPHAKKKKFKCLMSAFGCTKEVWGRRMPCPDCRTKVRRLDRNLIFTTVGGPLRREHFESDLNRYKDSFMSLMLFPGVHLSPLCIQNISTGVWENFYICHPDDLSALSCDAKQQLLRPLGEQDRWVLDNDGLFPIGCRGKNRVLEYRGTSKSSRSLAFSFIHPTLFHFSLPS